MNAVRQVQKRIGNSGEGAAGMRIQARRATCCFLQAAVPCGKLFTSETGLRIPECLACPAATGAGRINTGTDHISAALLAKLTFSCLICPCVKWR